MMQPSTDARAPWLEKKGNEEPDNGGRTISNYYVPPVDAVLTGIDARRAHERGSAGSIVNLVYDAMSNLTSEEDPNSNDTTHTYDNFDRLTQTLNALSGTTSYGYERQR